MFTLRCLKKLQASETYSLRYAQSSFEDMNSSPHFQSDCSTLLGIFHCEIKDLFPLSLNKHQNFTKKEVHRALLKCDFKEKGGVFVRIISAFVKKTVQRRWIFCVPSGLCNLISSFPVSQKLWYSAMHVYRDFFFFFALCCLLSPPVSKGIVNKPECLFAQLIFTIVLTLFKAI